MFLEDFEGLRKLNERLEARRNSLNQFGMDLASELQPLIDYRFDFWNA